MPSIRPLLQRRIDLVIAAGVLCWWTLTLTQYGTWAAIATASHWSILLVVPVALGSSTLLRHRLTGPTRMPRLCRALAVTPLIGAAFGAIVLLSGTTGIYVGGLVTMASAIPLSCLLVGSWLIGLSHRPTPALLTRHGSR